MNHMNTLGWTLVHFIWQGALVAVMLAAVQAALRNGSARVRYAVACGAMLLMLVCAVATFIRLNAQASPSGPLSAQVAAPSGLTVPSPERSAPAVVPSTADLSRLLPWIVYVWMAGVSVLTLRSLGGWVVLQGFKGREARPAEPVWQQRLARLGRRLRVARTVKLCESTLAQAPSVIGWMRPVILMPVCALNGLTPEQLEGILAHELAHIRQNDYLVNLFQTCVETLLFYHPAVWWVGKRIRTERENCCDDLAVEVCGDALAYASALTQLEQIRSSAPQLAMAANGGSLLRRVQRLLSSRPAARVAPAGWIAGAALVSIFAAGWAAPLIERSNGLSLPQSVAQPVDPEAVPPAPAERVSASQIAQGAEREATASAERAAAEITEHTTRRIATSTAAEATERAPAIAADAAQATIPEQRPAPQGNADEPKGPSFIEEMEKAGFHNLTVDQLIALKIHGVNADYVRAIRAEGLQPTADQLVALKIHGVEPQYIDQFKSREWKLDIDHLLALRIHGVDPADLDKMSALGYKLSAEQAVAMRIHGLTPEFAAKSRDLGLGNPTFEQLLALKIHGADAGFLTGMKEAGIRGLNFNTLVALKIHGADPGQVKEFGALGFKDLSAEELVATRIHGVTPEYIREIRKRGFKDLTLEQIIRLKQYGILDKQGSL